MQTGQAGGRETTWAWLKFTMKGRQTGCRQGSDGTDQFEEIGEAETQLGASGRKLRTAGKLSLVFFTVFAEQQQQQREREKQVVVGLRRSKNVHVREVVLMKPGDFLFFV